MNVTFTLPSEEMTTKFVKEAENNGLVTLKVIDPLVVLEPVSITQCLLKA